VNVGERWERAEAAWAQLAPDTTGAELVEQAESIRTEGRAALEASLFAEVGRHAERLETLGRTASLENIWERQRDAVVALEAAADGDAGRAGATGQLELLGRIRSAVAGGNADDLASLEQAIRKESSRTRERAGGPTPVPQIGKAARKLNERYHAQALSEFDRLTAGYERALRDRNSEEMARLGSQIERTYERLLRPAPVMRRPLPLFAAAAMVAVALVSGALLMGGTEKSVVAVVSAVGETRIVQILRDGRQVDQPPGSLTVTESGARWELEAGSYSLTMDGGREVRFDVPATTTLVLPGTPTDFASELMKELQLEDAIAAVTSR